MKQKRHSTEAIIRILRQSEGDETVESICREHNISKATFHRWKRKYGDMDLADAKRLKELEKRRLFIFDQCYAASLHGPGSR